MNKMKKWRYTQNKTLMETAETLGISYSLAWRFENEKNISEKMNYFINHKLTQLIEKVKEEE